MEANRGSGVAGSPTTGQTTHLRSAPGALTCARSARRKGSTAAEHCSRSFSASRIPLARIRGNPCNVRSSADPVNVPGGLVRLAAVGRTLCSMTVRGVSREAAIADYGVVLTGEPDEDLVSYDAAATDAAQSVRSGGPPSPRPARRPGSRNRTQSHAWSSPCTHRAYSSDGTAITGDRPQLPATSAYRCAFCNDTAPEKGAPA